MVDGEWKWQRNFKATVCLIESATRRWAWSWPQWAVLSV